MLKALTRQVDGVSLTAELWAETSTIEVQNSIYNIQVIKCFIL
jgi:hypothetical protein